MIGINYLSLLIKMSRVTYVSSCQEIINNYYSRRQRLVKN